MSLHVQVDRQALWQSLQSRGLVSGDCPAATELETPWYVRLLIGAAGWLAAAFMLGFISLAFEFVFRNSGVAIALGSAMLVLAYIVLRNKDHNDFIDQFMLAISFAGQSLIAFGVFDVLGWNHGMAWFVLALLQLALAWLMPLSIHRVWSAFAAAMAFSFALAQLQVLYIQASLLMAVVAYVWINELRWAHKNHIIKAVGYGLTLALLYQASTGLLYQGMQILYSQRAISADVWIKPWMGEVLTGVVMLYVVWELLKRYKLAVPGKIANAALAGSLLLVLASIEANGMTIGVMVILLGYANGNKVLTGVGMASLLFYISSYYYFLHITLLDKAKLLAVLGVMLLMASWLVHRMWQTDKEVSHA